MCGARLCDPELTGQSVRDPCTTYAIWTRANRPRVFPGEIFGACTRAFLRRIRTELILADPPERARRSLRVRVRARRQQVSAFRRDRLETSASIPARESALGSLEPVRLSNDRSRDSGASKHAGISRDFFRERLSPRSKVQHGGCWREMLLDVFNENRRKGGFSKLSRKNFIF